MYCLSSRVEAVVTKNQERYSPGALTTSPNKTAVFMIILNNLMATFIRPASGQRFFLN